MISLSAKKRFAFAAIYSAILLAVPLVALEVFVRIFSPYGHSSPEIDAAKAFSYEPAVFARHVFRQEAKTVRDGELRYPISTNGYRGRGFSPDKPDGLVRVVVFGGSAVFDLSADEYNSWPELMERWLGERLEKPVEVLNAGIPGHSSADSLGRFLFEGHLFRPDAVVLYNAWNDVKLFHSGQPLLRSMKPFRPDPRLSYHGWWDKMLCRSSQLYVRLRNRFLNSRYRIGTEGALPNLEFAGQPHPAALDQYRLNLEMFVACARSIHALPVLVTQARLVAPANSPEQRAKIPYGYTAFDHAGLCNAFERTDEIVKQTGLSLGVPVVDASAAMTGRDEYLYDHVHTSSKGSALLASLVGQAVLDALRERDSAPAPASSSPVP